MASNYDVLLAPSEDVSTDDTLDPNLIDDDTSGDDADVDVSSDEDTDDAGSDDDAADDAGDDSADADADADVADADAVAQFTKGDGRRLPKELKELINSGTLDPNTAKLLKDLWFTNHSYKGMGKITEVQKMKEAVDAFGSIDDLVSFKQQLDLIGGTAGFEQMQSEIGQWNKLNEQFMNSDPNFASSMSKADPDAFAAFVPNALAQLGETHPEIYNHTMAQVIVNTMSSNGVVNAMGLMRQALESGNGQLAGQQFVKIEKALSALFDSAQKAPVRKGPDAQRQQLDTDRKKFEDERTQVFQREVNSTNLSWMEPKIKGELSAFLKGAEKQLSPNAYARFERAVLEDVNSILQQNPTFKKQRDALFAKRDTDGLKRLYQTNTASLFSKSARKIAAEFGWKPSAKAGAGKQQQTTVKGGTVKKAAPGFSLVSKHPTRAEVDWTKTNDDMAARDEYVLKSGQKIKVK